MSWSMHFVGRAIDVNQAIHEESGHYSGKSKTEIEQAAPHIIALLEMNQSEQATRGDGPDDFLVSVRAHGSASWRGDERISSDCYVEIKRLEGTHVKPPTKGQVG